MVGVGIGLTALVTGSSAFCPSIICCTSQTAWAGLGSILGLRNVTVYALNIASDGTSTTKSGQMSLYVSSVKVSVVGRCTVPLKIDCVISYPDASTPVRLSNGLSQESSTVQSMPVALNL